jgi:hypothetical protein
VGKVKDSGKKCLCKSCGCDLPRRPQEYRKGDCTKCFQAKKKRVADDLLKRPCKTCGKPIGTKDKRQIACSKDCGHKGRTLEKTVVECSVCGKSILRYMKSLEIRSKFACSAECQRVVAGRAGKDWVAGSAKAKKRWLASESKRRLACSEWIQAVSRKLVSVRALVIDTKGWEYRVALRINASRSRRRRKRIEPKHSRTIEQAIKKVRNERKLFELSDWEKKVGYRLSSHKARRALKANAQKQVEGVASRCNDQSKWVQVCFEWVGD